MDEQSLATDPNERAPQPAQSPRPARGLWWVPWAVLALLPIGAGVVAIAERWTPISDPAMITTLSVDSTRWPPTLIGMPTSGGVFTTEGANHPGPLAFWILSIPARLFGTPGYGMIVGVAAINAASLVLVGLATRRLFGRSASVLVAVAVAAMMAAQGGATWRDPFNPALALIPLLAFLMCTWCALSSSPWWLVPAAAAGSFAAQAHVADLPIFGLVALVVLARIVRALWSRGSDDWLYGPGRRRAVPAAILTCLILWTGPLIDQFFGTGNLLKLLGVANDGAIPTVGLRHGLGRLVDSLHTPPRWLLGLEVPPHSPSVSAIATATVFALAALALFVRSLRRRDIGTTMGFLIAGAASIASVVVGALIPAISILILAPNNRYMWLVVSLFTWLVVFKAALDLLEPRIPGALRRIANSRATPLATALVVVGLVGFGLSGSSPRNDPGSITFAPARLHGQVLASIAPPGGYVLRIQDGSPAHLLVDINVLAQLRLAGVHVSIPKDVYDPCHMLQAYAKRNPVTGHEGQSLILRTGSPDDPPPPGFRVVSFYDPSRPIPAFRGYKQTLMLAGSKPTIAMVGPANPQSLKVTPTFACGAALRDLTPGGGS